MAERLRPPPRPIRSAVALYPMAGCPELILQPAIACLTSTGMPVSLSTRSPPTEPAAEIPRPTSEQFARATEERR